MCRHSRTRWLSVSIVAQGVYDECPVADTFGCRQFDFYVAVVWSKDFVIHLFAVGFVAKLAKKEEWYVSFLYLPMKYFSQISLFSIFCFCSLFYFLSHGGEGRIVSLIRFLCCRYFLTSPSFGHLPYMAAPHPAMSRDTAGGEDWKWCFSFGIRIALCTSPLFVWLRHTPQCYGARQGREFNPVTTVSGIF